MSAKRRVAGFSVVEMLMTLSLVMAVTMMIGPRFNEAMEDFRRVSTAHTVASHAQRTRVLAVTQNASYRLRVTSSTTYVRDRLNSGSWVLTDSYTVPLGITLTGSTAQFLSRGNASPVTTFVIADNDGQSRQVVVELSGYVHEQ